ncbi:MAG: hypothetical protein KF832_01535 [Caldilineaceae bacterium]|nr:hypothetical protein [Caldilineaceae bacterium]
MSADRSPTQPPSPIQWVGVLFAIASNLLLVTVVDLSLAGRVLPLWVALLFRFLAPIIAGVVTTLYVGQRGGMHAFIGGMITIPLLALLVFGGNWLSALLAGALCALAGAVCELVLRQRR